MTTVPELLNSLREDDIILWLEGDRLRYRAPRGVLSDEYRATLAARKHEVIEYLQRADSDYEPPLLPGRLDGLHDLAFVQKSFVGYYHALENPAIQTAWFANRIRGDLQVKALEAAFRTLVVRHAALRVRYVRNSAGELKVQINTDPDFDFEQIPIGDSDTSGVVARQITEAVSTWFDLESGPLMRVRLLRLQPAEHVLIVVIHHSVCDAWSLGIISRELRVAYAAAAAGVPDPLPAPGIQVTDHTRWVTDWLASPGGRKHVEFWRKEFSAATDPFHLPRHFPGVSAITAAGEPTTFVLDATTLSGLRTFAREQQIALSTVVMTALAVVLRHWRQQNDVFVKILHPGRQRAELFDVVGCLADCFVLHVGLADATNLLETMQSVERAQRSALPHIQVNYWLMRELLAARPAQQPLLDVHFNYRNADIASAPPTTSDSARMAPDAALQIEPVDPGAAPTGVSHATALDPSTGIQIIVIFSEDPTSLSCSVRHVHERFEPQTVPAFCRAMRQLLERLASEPILATRPLETLIA